MIVRLLRDGVLSMAVFLAFTGFSAASAATVATSNRPVEPRQVELDCDWFTHTAHWERVRGRQDGRLHGSSLRSFHPGERATLDFNGEAVRLYGVLGPGGGAAIVSLDGHVGHALNFFATHKETHKQIYASPKLKRGTHRLVIDVVRPHERAASPRYVNLDGADVVL